MLTGSGSWMGREVRVWLHLGPGRGLYCSAGPGMAIGQPAGVDRPVPFMSCYAAQPRPPTHRLLFVPFMSCRLSSAACPM